MNRYTNRERAAVKSVVVDLNARIIIDRFHIVQLVGKKLTLEVFLRQPL